MNIKNYTSSVPVDRSIMLIEKLLIDIGAANINKSVNRETKMVSGIVFEIWVNGDPLLFKLPAKITECYNVMLKNVSARSAIKKETQSRIKEQAARTAWKILYEKISIQCTMIQLEQTKIVEEFLAYVYNPKLDQTYFELIEETKYKMLESKK